MKSRILLVDDHAVLREGLRLLLARARPKWTVCGEASDGKQAIEMARDLKPDVIVMDISMPVMSGLDACSELRRQGINTPVLVFTTHQSTRLELEVRQVGAQGLVMKSQAVRDLVLAIDKLLAGGTFFDPSREKASEPKPEKGSGGLSFCLGFAFC